MDTVYSKERRFAVTDAKQRPGFQTAAALTKRRSLIGDHDFRSRRVRDCSGPPRISSPGQSKFAITRARSREREARPPRPLCHAPRGTPSFTREERFGGAPRNTDRRRGRGRAFQNGQARCPRSPRKISARNCLVSPGLLIGNIKWRTCSCGPRLLQSALAHRSPATSHCQSASWPWLWARTP